MVADINEFRYREIFRVSKAQLLDEPDDVVAQANLIWSLDKERDRLEERRRNQGRPQA